MDVFAVSAAARGVDQLNQRGESDVAQTFTAFRDLAAGGEVRLRGEEGGLANVRDVIARAAALSLSHELLASAPSVREVQERAREASPALVFASLGLHHALEDFRRAYAEVAGAPRAAALDPLKAILGHRPVNGASQAPRTMPRTKAPTFDALVAPTGEADPIGLVPVESVPEPKVPAEPKQPTVIEPVQLGEGAGRAEDFFAQMTRGLDPRGYNKKKMWNLAVKMAGQ